MLINGAKNPQFSCCRPLTCGDKKTTGYIKPKVKKKGTLRAQEAARTERFCSKSRLANRPDPKDSDWDSSLFMLLTDTVYGFKDTYGDGYAMVRHRQTHRQCKRNHNVSFLL